MNECPQCGSKFESGGEVTHCSHCGSNLNTPAENKENNIITRYIETVWDILTSPGVFFRKMPVSGGLSGPLAFALVTHWLGAVFSFLWFALMGGAMSTYFSSISKMMVQMPDVDSFGRSGRYTQFIDVKQRLTSWFFGTGSVIADPFITLSTILMTSFIVFLGARILVSPKKLQEDPSALKEITFESALRIVCYGVTPAILAIIPVFGPVISKILILIVTVIGAKEVYRVSTGRAIVIALFPKILIFVMFFAVLAMMLLAMLKFVLSF